MKRFVSSLVCAVSLASALNAAAQSCSDSDTGNNPTVRGTVTVVTSSGAKSEYRDVCDASGISLREYLCTSATGSVTSQVHRGPYGCLDGAVVEAGIKTPGCFTTIDLSISPSSTTDPTSTAVKITIDKVEQTIAPLWWAAARSANERDEEDLEVIIRDGAGVTLSTLYADVAPKYFHVSDPELLAQGAARVVLPFYPTARSILLKVFGAELSYTLPSASLRCVRPPIAIGFSGTEGEDTCVSGAVKRSLNPTTFTCVPGPTPSATTTPVATTY